jgi:hypothetical protein
VRDRKGKAQRGRGEAEKTQEGHTADCADKRGSEKFVSRLEAFAPERESVDERFFQPGLEAALGGFIGFDVVLLLSQKVQPFQLNLGI